MRPFLICHCLFHRGCNRTDRTRAAFTLIEVIIAMGILAFGSVAILTLYATAVKEYREAIGNTQMALLAEKILTEAQDYIDNTANPTGIDWKTDPGFPRFSYKMHFDKTNLENEYRIHVIIGWGTQKHGAGQNDDDLFNYREDLYTVLLKRP